jgi:succinate dehydrogenase hydrophobic anchor subunit
MYLCVCLFVYLFIFIYYAISADSPVAEVFNPLNAELNPICHLLALLGAHHIFHVNGLRVKNKIICK